MNFFSSDVGNDGSAIAAAINKATSNMLLSADWGQNLEICDMINTNPQNISSASKMLRRQLRSDNATVVKLALELTDACVKNCTRAMHEAVGSEAFLGDMVALAEPNKRSGALGFEVQEMARKLIQQWGVEFASQRDVLPGFHETYAMLRTKGLQFPEHESSAPVFTPPPVLPEDTAPLSQGTTSQPSTSSTSGEDKLRQDLQVVQERIGLCRDMLPESPGIEQDDALSEVIGFLEACQPRLSQLIEAGMQGVLSEDLLSSILHINDELHKTLDAERHGTPLEGGKMPATNSLLDVGGSEQIQDTTGASTSALPAPVITMPTGGVDDDDDDELTLSSSNRRRGKKTADAPPVAASTTANDYLGVLEAELGSVPQQQPSNPIPEFPATISTISPPPANSGVLQAELGSVLQQQPPNPIPEFSATIGTTSPPPAQPPVNVSIDPDPFSTASFDPPPSASDTGFSSTLMPPQPGPSQAPPLEVNTVSITADPADPFASVPILEPTITQGVPPEPVSTNPFDDPVFHGSVVTPSDPNDFVTYQAQSAEQILGVESFNGLTPPEQLAASLRQPSQEDVSQIAPKQGSLSEFDANILSIN